MLLGYKNFRIEKYFLISSIFFINFQKKNFHKFRVDKVRILHNVTLKNLKLKVKVFYDLQQSINVKKFNVNKFLNVIDLIIE